MLTLGIDCGTSKVAVALVDAAGVPVHADSAPHHADLPAPTDHAEQDPAKILATAQRLVSAVPAALREQVVAIGITGQMHGVLLHDADGTPKSPLVTWQDRRALIDPAFLPSLGRKLNTGYGMATLGWWARRGELPVNVRAASILGFVAARWCGLDRAPIDPTDAQAWGGLEPLPGIPPAILPRSVGHGERVGALTAASATALGLKAGIPVAAPLGDNQASLRATLSDPARELAFTVGTSCQLAAVVRRDAKIDLGIAELRPYDDQHSLLVAAPLCGGVAWLWLADTAMAWATDLGLTPPSREDTLALLDRLGLAARDRLTFAPHLSGERHDPTLTGSLHGVTLDGGKLGEVARAVARGISANARDMLPASVRAGRQRLVVGGNALRRSALLRAMAEAEFGLPLVFSQHREEAATGAALVALATVRS